jgi:hypothetical protein
MESSSASLKQQGPFFGDGGRRSWAVIRNRNRIHNCGSQTQFKEPDLIDNISSVFGKLQNLTKFITGETKKEGQRKAKRCITRRNRKKKGKS